MKAKKILFITQEITPYVPESQMAILGRELPQVIQERSREIRTFMPKWGIVNERRNQLHEVIRLSGMNLIIDDTDHPLIIKVASLPSARMQIYFIDNDDYFAKRLMSLDAKGREYKDNAERACFYARGVLETMKKLRWAPDIIHCQGWISSIVPLYLKSAYEEEPAFRDCRVIYTPSNERLKANIGTNFAKVLNFKNADIKSTSEYGKKLNMTHLDYLGIKYSDGVTLVEENEELANYAASLNKPILIHKEDKDNMQEYATFFDGIWSIGKAEVDEDDDI